MGENNLAVIMVDALMVAATPIMKQMVEQFHSLQIHIIGVENASIFSTN